MGKRNSTEFHTGPEKIENKKQNTEYKQRTGTKEQKTKDDNNGL